MRCTIVSSVTREFCTRIEPSSHWTRGTVSGKVKSFVSTPAFYPFRGSMKTEPRQHFRHTCYKKVFVKRHFLKNRPTQYTYLSKAPELKLPTPSGRVAMMYPKGSCNFVFGKFSFSYSLVLD